MLRQEVARAEKLRYKRLWTNMISVIAGAMPERVWLIQLSTDPANPPANSRRPAPVPLRPSADSHVEAATPKGPHPPAAPAGRRLFV